MNRKINKNGKFWSFDEEVFALYLYKFGIDEFKRKSDSNKKTFQNLSKKINRTDKAILYRFRHYDDIMGYSGVKNHSKLSVSVIDTFKSIKKPIHKKLIQSYIKF